MDEMDYVMHDHEPPGSQSQHHQQQQPQQHRQPSCPYWRDQAAQSSPTRNLAGHHQYDPLANSAWFAHARTHFSTPPGVTGLPLHPGAPPHHHHHHNLRPLPDSYYYASTLGTSAAPSSTLTTSSQAHGHNQTPSQNQDQNQNQAQNQNQNQAQTSAQTQTSSRHDHFPNFPILPRHPAANLRLAPLPGSAQSPPPTASQQMPFGSSERTGPFPSSRGLTLPSINPQMPPPPAGTDSESSSPSGPASETSQPHPDFNNPSPYMLAGLGYAPSRHRHQAPVRRTEIAHGSLPPATTPISLPTDRHRHHATRPRRSSSRPNPPGSDYDSDEDNEFHELIDDEQQALRLIEHFANPPVAVRVAGDYEEGRTRAHQLLRGQISSKRVASKSALASLQSVDIGDLPKAERMCVICYNEFGVCNPEGVNEAPLRLPKCKHVFGDHCIKKWFEESDSCPYCRDKVPSSPHYTARSEALRELLRRSSSPRYAARPGEARPQPSAFGILRHEVDSYARFASQREEPRNGADAGSPPRTWQTGDRRSPPAEASEGRRRTRPRHGSVRAANPTPSSNSNPAPPASLQPSPATARDRFSPAGYRPYSYGGSSGARQVPPAAVTLHVEPTSLAPPSAMANLPLPGFAPPPPLGSDGPGLGLRSGAPPHMDPPSIEVTGTLPRVPGMPHFQAVESMDGPGYAHAPDGGDHSASVGGYWYE